MPPWGLLMIAVKQRSTSPSANNYL